MGSSNLNPKSVVAEPPGSSQIPLQAASPHLYHRLKDWLWGYDFFISYHWASGGKYAVALARALSDRGYDCFIDRADYAMGDDWKSQGERALRNTQRLLLIATREAITQSQPVRREIEIFTARSRHVIPIVFGIPFSDDERRQNPILDRIPDSQLYLEELSENRELGPSPVIVDQLVRTDRLLRRRTLRARITSASLTILTVATILASVSWWRASTARQAEASARKAQAHELANSYWQLGVVARDREDDLVAATHRFLFAARSEQEAGNRTASRNLLLAADASGGHLRASFAHESSVSGFTISPAATHVVTWNSATGSARLWALDRPAPLRILPHAAVDKKLLQLSQTDIGGAAFNADGTRILTWSEPPREMVVQLAERLVNLWDVDQEQPIRTYRGQLGAAFVGNSGRVATWEWNKLTIWDPEQADPVHVLKQEGNVSEAAFSPDGRWMATRVDGHPAQLWDLHAAEPEPFDLNEGYSSRVLFSRDGSRILAIGGADGQATLWDVATQKQVRTMKHDDRIQGATINTDCSFIVTWDHKVMRIWKTSVGEHLSESQVGKSLTNLATFNVKGDRLVTINDGREVSIYDLASDKPKRGSFYHLKWDDQPDPVLGACFSPDGVTVMTWNNRFAKFWHTEGEWINANPYGILPLAGSTQGLTFLDDDSVIVIGPRRVVWVWDIKRSSQPTATFKHARFGPQGAVVSWQSDGAVSLWEAPYTRPQRTLQCDPKHLTGEVQVSSRKLQVLTLEPSAEFTLARQYKACRLIDLAGEEAKTVWEFPGDEQLRGAVFCLDDSRILAWHGKSCELWDPAKSEPVWTYTHELDIARASLSRDGSHLLIASSASFSLLSGPPPTDTLVTLGNPQSVRKLSRSSGDALLSRDGLHALTHSGDNAYWWNLSQEEPIRALHHDAGPEFRNPKMRILGALLLEDPPRAITWGHDESLLLWDLSNGELTRRFSHPSSEIQPPVILSPDQSLLISSHRAQSNSEGTTFLWDITKSAPLRRFEQHETFTYAEFGPDERFLLMDRNGSTVIWDLSGTASEIAAEQRIRKFEARSASYLDASAEVRPFDPHTRQGNP